MEPSSRWWVDRAAGLGEEELQEITHAYWHGDLPAPGADAGQRIAWYIRTLLPEELNHADAVRGAIQLHPCDTLVLLVGHSPEPLLQAIGVFQPLRLVLLLNQWYGQERGICRGSELAGWIMDGLAPYLPVSPAIEMHEVPDQPDAVFQSLCKHVLAGRLEGQPVIVDITGAKKSIVAGAFLFAAYADIPISYVDFDDYDAAMRRPPGYRCRIGTLANPYDAFRLREWERVRRLYGNYQFHAAAAGLEELAQFVRGPARVPRSSASVLDPFRPGDALAVETLLRVVQFYAAWDDGNYAQARQMLPEVQRRLPGFPPPAAVTSLGDVWPYASGAPTAEEAACRLLCLHDELPILESNALLIPYARDELAKIERLAMADEDNRSALLRAAGLDELLLKARLVCLWRAGEIDVWEWQAPERQEVYLGRAQALDGELRATLYGRLLEHDGIKHMRRTLAAHTEPGWTMPAYLRLDASQEYHVRPAHGALRLAKDPPGTALAGETLTRLRNKAVHMCLYVTQPIARAAVDLARANLDDFESRWAPLVGPVPACEPAGVERQPWEALCRLCGLDFLPLAPAD